MLSEQQISFHHFLGAYIAKTTEIESEIDRVIASFFNVNGQVRNQFQWWVMGRLEFGMKLEVLGGIIELLKEKPRFKKLMASLKAMMERRNDLAHGDYQQLIEVDEEGNKVEGLARWHRKSKTLATNSMKKLDLAALGMEVAELDKLWRPIRELSRLCRRLWPYVEVSENGKTEHQGNFQSLRTRS
jgi:hypothetical protein